MRIIAKVGTHSSESITVLENQSRDSGLPEVGDYLLIRREEGYESRAIVENILNAKNPKYRFYFLALM